MEKLKLSTAQAGWNRGEHDNKWQVRTPEGEVLYVLNGSFDEQSAMQAIHLGRIFEEKAFNIGVARGKEIQAVANQNELVQLRAAVRSLGEMNEKLSEQLERHINQD